MNDDTLRSLYRRHLAARSVDRDQCPSIESLEALVNRAGAEADRLHTLDHVMACPACRHDFDLMRAAADAARASTRPDFRVPLAIAAALLLLAAGGLLWSTRRPVDTAVRGEPDGVTLLLPTDDAATVQPVQLLWHSVAGAFQYQVEVLEEDGSVRYHATTNDTSATIPADSLAAGGSYDWWVRAELSDAGERRSPLHRFTVQAP